MFDKVNATKFIVNKQEAVKINKQIMVTLNQITSVKDIEGNCLELLKDHLVGSILLKEAKERLIDSLLKEDSIILTIEIDDRLIEISISVLSSPDDKVFYYSIL